MIAIVHRGDVNLNTELVRLGHAWALRKYLKRTDTDYCNREAEARTAKRALVTTPREARGPMGVSKAQDPRLVHGLQCRNCQAMH